MAEGAITGAAATEGELLTLQQAADRLKVHYMTAYRWVRRGQLPAFKAGGRLRVRGDDLARFISEREVDVISPSSDGQHTDWPVHIDRLHQMLADGEGVEAGALVRKVVADGAPAGDVYLYLIAPVLHRIGDDWAAERISVAVEHRASEIATALMARLGEHFRRRGPSRGTAVTLTPPGDQHGLGSMMVADFLRAGGFDVHHLGPNVPIGDLELFLQVVPTDLVCVSVTNPTADVALYESVVTASRASNPEVVVVFGGQGIDAQRVERAGGRVVTDLADLTRCLASPARP